MGMRPSNPRRLSKSPFQPSIPSQRFGKNHWARARPTPRIFSKSPVLPPSPDGHGFQPKFKIM
eukprot:4767162-Karenia_brevis.AAC.1